MTKSKRNRLNRTKSDLRKLAAEREVHQAGAAFDAAESDAPEAGDHPSADRSSRKVEPKAHVAERVPTAELARDQARRTTKRPMSALVNRTRLRSKLSEDGAAIERSSVDERRSAKAGGAPPRAAKTAVVASGAKRRRDPGKPGMGGKSKKEGTAPKTPFSPKPLLKVEKRLRLPNGRTVEIGGLRTADGQRWVFAREGRRFAIMPYSCWHGSGANGSNALRDQGITIIGGMSEVKQAVGELKRFPLAHVITRPGWSGNAFALADGRVLKAKGQTEPLKTYLPDDEMLRSGGSLEGWREQVALPLENHQLASFGMMAMFAAPLLRLTSRVDNFGFEMAGPAGRGKSTLQLLMASAAGPAIGCGDATYWRTCNTTMNALETTMAQFSDMTLILDEAGLVQDGGRMKGRANEMRNMAFRLSAGRVKHRHGEKAGPIHRLVFVISTNQPIGTLLGKAHAAEGEAIADRLMTLPLLPERTDGIFDRCPPEYESTGAFADALKAAAAENYGHAVPAFLQWLVEQRQPDPARFSRRIARNLARFVQSTDADPNNGSERRVAEAFGLVAVAGVLAKRAGVLPPSYQPHRTARACYDLHRQHGRAPRSFDDRLRALVRHPDTIDLDIVDVSTLSAERLAACRAFLYTGRSKCRELLVPVKHRPRVFPDWNEVRHGLEVGQRLKVSDDRNTVDRPVGFQGKKMPVYCFDLTDLAV